MKGNLFIYLRYYNNTGILSTATRSDYPAVTLAPMIFPKNDPAVKRLHYYDRVVPVISVSSVIIIKRTVDPQPRSLIPGASHVAQYDILIPVRRIILRRSGTGPKSSRYSLRNSIPAYLLLMQIEIESVPRKWQIYSRPFSRFLARDSVIINPRRTAPRRTIACIETGSSQPRDPPCTKARASERSRRPGTRAGMRELFAQEEVTRTGI